MNNLDAIYDFILNELRKLTLNENLKAGSGIEK